MIVIDTSLWIDLYRDRTGKVANALEIAVDGADVRTVPFVITELLQGARNEQEWAKLSAEFLKLPGLAITDTVWTDAARIFYDLRRSALTVRSTIDCLIAQMCLTHDCVLLHNDHDFDRIATARPLKHLRLDAARV